MPVTNSAARTRIDEIAEGLWRISTPVELPGAAGFSFNQYLLVDVGRLVDDDFTARGCLRMGPRFDSIRHETRRGPPLSLRGAHAHRGPGRWSP